MNGVEDRASARSSAGTALSSLRDRAASRLDPDGLQSTDATLPRVTTKVRKPDFSLWPNGDEMRAIWGDDE